MVFATCCCKLLTRRVRLINPANGISAAPRRPGIPSAEYAGWCSSAVKVKSKVKSAQSVQLRDSRGLQPPGLRQPLGFEQDTAAPGASVSALYNSIDCGLAP